MSKLLVHVTAICLSITLLAGCEKQEKAPTSPVYEGRIGELLTDGTIGVRAIEFHESFGGAVGGPFGFGGSGVSLGMTYELVNLGAAAARFDKIGILFQTTTVGKTNDFFASANTMTVMTAEGLTTYFGGFFGSEKPELPPTRNRPFVIPPSKAMQLEVSGHGTPLQLVVGDDGEARRDYKVTITVYSGEVASHGPFTVNVTAREGKDRKLVFK